MFHCVVVIPYNEDFFPDARKVKYTQRLRIPDSSDSEDESLGDDDSAEAAGDEDATRTSSHVLTPGEESNTSAASTVPSSFPSRSPPLREFLQQLTAMRIQVENHPLSSPGA